MKLLIVICILIVIAIFIFAKRNPKWPVSNVCSICGAKSQRDSQEDPEKMKPLCRKCLMVQLERDYADYPGRAVVVQPAVGPPCFVFQEINEWNSAFKDSKIGKDAQGLLAGIKPQCHECGEKAKYLWVNSSGLTGDNFPETLDKGISQTLLSRNPKPISLCGKCCVVRISDALDKGDIQYMEVCGPRGSADGFVVPMGY